MPCNRIESSFVKLAGLLGLLAACQAIAPPIPARRTLPRSPPTVTSIDAVSEQRDERATRPAPTPPPPMPRIADDEKVSLELRGVSLAQAIHMIAETAKVNLYIADGLSGTVDASFPSVTLDDALRTLLAQNDLRLVEAPENVFWVEHSDGSAPRSETFAVLSMDPVQAGAALKELLANATVVVDKGHGLVVVRGTEADVQMARDFLQSADRVKSQVLLEVRVLEISLVDGFQLGIDAAALGTIDGDAFNIVQALATSSDDVRVSINTPDVDATINVLAEYVGVQVLSAPKVLAVTGTESLIEVVEEVPYINVTSTTTGTTGGIGSTVVEEVQFKQSGIKMKVTPTIQADGMLDIVLDQEFSEVVGTFQGIPIIDKRHISANFLVRDRGTIVLGGLVQRRKRENDRGIPGLMDLPLIGRLFRSDEDRAERRELIVFLTPRIIDPHEATQLSERYEQDFQRNSNSEGAPELQPK
jgi:type II secretory pathway component GspD/PulD (secretin)